MIYLIVQDSETNCRGSKSEDSVTINLILQGIKKQVLM